MLAARSNAVFGGAASGGAVALEGVDADGCEGVGRLKPPMDGAGADGVTTAAGAGVLGRDGAAVVEGVDEGREKPPMLEDEDRPEDVDEDDERASAAKPGKKVAVTSAAIKASLVMRRGFAIM